MVQCGDVGVWYFEIMYSHSLLFHVSSSIHNPSYKSIYESNNVNISQKVKKSIPNASEGGDLERFFHKAAEMSRDPGDAHGV